VVPPPAGPHATLADVTAYPAVSLFLDRLARVRRAPVEPDEVGLLVALVRRLGGLPLALELAAARGRVLTIAEILDRYGHRVLDLDGPPGSTARTALPGADETVVSVRDAVAASYRLLGPAERYVLRRLSTFRNRWSLALAESMIDGPAAGTDPVHLLDRLLELGLLSVRGSGAFRFRLLDVVRDFAMERAAATGDLAAARRRHAEVLADLAQQIAPGLVGAKLSEAASRLDEVSGDLGAALGFAAGEDPHTALRIAAAVPRWWRFRGRDVTGRQWLRRLLDDPRTGDADAAVRAWARVGLGQLALEHGAGAEEIGSAEAALTAFESLGSVSGQLTARTLLATLWMTTGNHDEARRHGAVALDLARRSGRIRDVAVAENNLTWHEIREGDLSAARRRLMTVDRLANRCGEHRLRAVAVANLAEVARLDGRFDEAHRLGRRAMAALADVGDPNHRRRLLATIGLALAETDRLEEAGEVLAELRTPTGAAEDGPAAIVDGAIAFRRGDHARAAACFASAADRYDGGHDPRDVVEALVRLIACTSDAEPRRAAVQRLDRLCQSGGITLLPPERRLLAADAVSVSVQEPTG
jgi:tetratricopeptide (TPR) repeat protein